MEKRRKEGRDASINICVWCAPGSQRASSRQLNAPVRLPARPPELPDGQSQRHSDAICTLNRPPGALGHTDLVGGIENAIAIVFSFALDVRHTNLSSLKKSAFRKSGGGADVGGKAKNSCKIIINRSDL